MHLVSSVEKSSHRRSSGCILCRYFRWFSPGLAGSQPLALEATITDRAKNISQRQGGTSVPSSSILTFKTFKPNPMANRGYDVVVDVDAEVTNPALLLIPT